MDNINHNQDRLDKLPKKTYDVVTNIIKFINKQDEINASKKNINIGAEKNENKS